MAAAVSRPFVAFSFILFLASLPAGAEAQRIRHQGYSVERPQGSGWRVIRNAPTILAFRRQEAGNPTTVIAFGRPLRQRASSYSGLEAIAARLTRSEEGDRPSRRELAGGRCVFKRFLRPSTTSTTRKFMLRGADLFCIHPQSGAVVHLGFSQRYPADDAPVGTGGEMLSFFNSLRFH